MKIKYLILCCFTAYTMAMNNNNTKTNITNITDYEYKSSFVKNLPDSVTAGVLSSMSESESVLGSMLKLVLGIPLGVIIDILQLISLPVIIPIKVLKQNITKNKIASKLIDELKSGDLIKKIKVSLDEIFKTRNINTEQEQKDYLENNLETVKEKVVKSILDSIKNIYVNELQKQKIQVTQKDIEKINEKFKQTINQSINSNTNTSLLQRINEATVNNKTFKDLKEELNNNIDGLQKFLETYKNIQNGKIEIATLKTKDGTYTYFKVNEKYYEYNSIFIKEMNKSETQDLKSKVKFKDLGIQFEGYRINFEGKNYSSAEFIRYFEETPTNEQPTEHRIPDGIDPYFDRFVE